MDLLTQYCHKSILGYPNYLVFYIEKKFVKKKKMKKNIPKILKNSKFKNKITLLITIKQVFNSQLVKMLDEWTILSFAEETLENGFRLIRTAQIKSLRTNNNKVVKFAIIILIQERTQGLFGVCQRLFFKVLFDWKFIKIIYFFIFKILFLTSSH